MLDKERRDSIIGIASDLVAQGIGPEHDRACYLRLTENRADWKTSDGTIKHYGWCGDFISFVLSRAGVMDGRILNRAELNNGKWVPGDNLARIQRWAKGNDAVVSVDAVRADPALLTPGDIVIFVRTDGDHIAFFEDWTAAGQFTSLDGNSFGRVCKRNGRNLVPASNAMPIRHFINVTNLPLNTSGHETAGFVETELQPDLIASGGDSSELWIA